MTAAALEHVASSAFIWSSTPLHIVKISGKSDTEHLYMLFQ